MVPLFGNMEVRQNDGAQQSALLLSKLRLSLFL